MSTRIHEIHVSPGGSDNASGNADSPLRSINLAAALAQPGDVITVHAGIYRECVEPPRGGESDERRITYQAAPGERVEISGSEVVKDWTPSAHGVWKAVLPNSFFGDFNPYADRLKGDWFFPMGRESHSGAVYLNGHWHREAASYGELLACGPEELNWFAEVGAQTTTICARFGLHDPNHETVEINVRRSVFYPPRPGINYLTVRGFILRHAATPWAPPTAEQVGLIGTHWSKGWIIEDNTVCYSRCSGISLGKYGDVYDNTSADTAEGYVETVKRAIANGWNRETIGSHIVRRNTVAHCEQAGIVGSLGCAFSEISENIIHHIHEHRLFDGAEQSGIKFHGAVDTVIRGNRVFDCHRGLWLDWMTQGTRVTGNLCYRNRNEDLFLEVNHGPYLVDHNVFLSETSLVDWSQGGAFVHNLFDGKIKRNSAERETPYMKAHSTEILGLKNIVGGDNRFLNNVVRDWDGLADYLKATLPVLMAGNAHTSIPTTIVEEAGTVWIEVHKIYEGGKIYESGHDPLGTVIHKGLLGRSVMGANPFPGNEEDWFTRDLARNPRSPAGSYPGPWELWKWDVGGRWPIRFGPVSYGRN